MIPKLSGWKLPSQSARQDHDPSKPVKWTSRILEDNKHEELPQKIFEVGETVYLDEEKETRPWVKKMAAMITHSQANLTEIKSITHALVSNLGLEMVIEDLDQPTLSRGDVHILRVLKGNLRCV